MITLKIKSGNPVRKDTHGKQNLGCEKTTFEIIFLKKKNNQHLILYVQEVVTPLI